MNIIPVFIGKNKMSECRFLIDNSNYMHKKGKCEITNDLCAYCRYCQTKDKIVSSELYKIHGCNVEKKYSERNHNMEDKQNKRNKDNEEFTLFEKVENNEFSSKQEESKNIDKIEKLEKPKKETKFENIPITQTKECDVVYIHKNKTAINFDGIKFFVNGIFNNKVNIKYSGTIGKPDFKVIDVK